MAGGYNLQTYKEEFLSKLLQRNIETISDASISDAEIFRRLTAATVRCQKEFRIKITRNTNVPLTANVDQYDLPVDRLNRAIDSVYVQPTGFDRPYKLQFVSNEVMQRLFDIGSTADDQGNPRYVALSTDVLSRFIIRPVPKTGGTISINHANYPETLERIYNQTTVTAAFTLNSQDVLLTLNGAATPIDAVTGKGRIRSGDEIGIVPTIQSDGSTISGLSPSPVKWYQVKEVGKELDGTPNALNLVISFPFQEITDPTATFISAQVSEIEFAAPGSMEMAPVYMALADYYQRENPGYAQFCLQEVERIKERTMPEDPDEVDTYRSDAFQFEWQRNRISAPGFGGGSRFF